MVDETPDPATPETPQPYKRLEFATKDEADQHYNAIFADRDQRMRKTIRDEVTSDLLERLGMDDVDEVAAVFEEAQAMTQAEQTDAVKEKKRAEKLARQIEKHESTIASLNTQIEELGADKERVNTLSDLLKGQMKAKMEQVQEPFRELLEDKTVEEQAAWFEKNADKLEAPTKDDDTTGDNGPAWTQRPAGQPATGSPATGGKDPEKEAQARREQSITGISRI